MKLNTTKYKLTIYTETECTGCIELKELLKNNSIPFTEKSITPEKSKQGPRMDNRWEYIDLTREHEEVKLVPVIVVDDVDNNTTYHSAGYDFDEAKEGLEVLKQYFI